MDASAPRVGKKGVGMGKWGDLRGLLNSGLDPQRAGRRGSERWPIYGSGQRLATQLPAADVVRYYKALSAVVRAFRSLKTVELLQQTAVSSEREQAELHGFPRRQRDLPLLRAERQARRSPSRSGRRR